MKQMNNLNYKSKVLIFTALSAVLILSYLLLLRIEDRDIKQEGYKVSSVELPDTVVPGNLPSTLPVEPGAQVINNQLLLSNDGRQQANREVITEQYQTARQALDFYITYFETQNYIGGYVPELSTSEMEIAQMRSEEGVLTIIATERSGKINVETTLTSNLQ